MAWSYRNDAADQVLANSPVTQNGVNVDYTFRASDSGKSLFHDSPSAHTWTIPANATTPFLVGAAITIINNTGSGALTLVCPDVLRRGDGTAGIGSRTVGPDSIATVIKTKPAEWMITGKFS